MPTLMLRALSSDLAARLKAYADAHGLGRGAAAMQLLTIALDHLEARRAGAAVTNDRSLAERRASARHAAEVRWARHRTGS